MEALDKQDELKHHTECYHHVNKSCDVVQYQATYEQMLGMTVQHVNDAFLLLLFLMLILSTFFFCILYRCE